MQSNLGKSSVGNYIIYPNGYECPVYPKKDGKYPLTQLQDIVGGYIGIEDMEEQVVIYNDSESDLPYNRKATELIRQTGYKGLLSGPVVILERGLIKI